MTKLLQNKTIIKFLGIALSILLIVALVPQINIAYGSKDDVATETPTAETGDNATAKDEEGTEGEEAAGEVVGVSEEDGTQSGDIDLVGNATGGEDTPAADATPLVTTEAPTGSISAQSKARAAVPKERRAAVYTVTSKGGDRNKVRENGGVITFDGGTHTLTVNGELNGNVVIKNGAKVTVEGNGTIKGLGTGSVIDVYDKGSKLILDGPIITGGKGTNITVTKWVIWANVGGGIYVHRGNSSNADAASFEFKSGIVKGNEANAGGGIFIDFNCGFTMSGGTVQENTALAHEGGGIFIWGNWNGKSGDKRESYCHITKGEIKNNKTLTTTDWGGGGVYINNEGSLRIDTARITNNTAKSLGGGVAGCPHAKIGIGTIDNGAAVYANMAEGKVGPVNKGLKFNMPDSYDFAGKKVPSGDFLVKGITSDEIKALTGDPTATELGYADTPYTITAGDYAKNVFDVDLAKDFYCTYASFMGATNLKDHPKDENKTEIAWKGFIAGLSADKVVDNKVTEKDANKAPNWVASKIAIPVNQNYEVHDATLCLTSTAKEDKSDIKREVSIKGNTSNTHGGGVACNGTLQFGEYPQQDKVVNSYTLSLTKKVISGITGEALTLVEGDKYTFTLTDGTNTYTAVSNEKGEINFTNLPGLEASTTVPITKTFTLKETDAKGLDSSIPEEGISVDVKLNVKSSSVTYGNMTTTTYTTTPSDVTIYGQSGNNAKTVTNTLNLRAKESIPVTKIADGIAGGSFAFGFKKIDNIDDVVNDPGNPTELKRANSLLGIATAEGAIVKPIEWQPDEPSTRKTGVVSFTEEYTTPGTYWYAIAEQNGGTQDVANDVDYDGTTYLVKVDVTLSENKRSLDTAKTIYKVVPGSTALEQVQEDIGVTFTNVKMKYAPFELVLNKQVVTTLPNQVQVVGWNDLSNVNKKFNFSVYDPTSKKVIFEGENEGNIIDLKVVTGEESVVEGYVKAAYQEYLKNPTDAFEYTVNNLMLKEEMPAGVAQDEHMTLIEDAEVAITLGIESARRNGDNTSFQVVPKVKDIILDGTRAEIPTVSNLYEPHGDWTLTADKHFQGLGEPAAEGYIFNMSELDVASDDEIQNAEQLAKLPTKKDSEGNELTWVGKTGYFQKNEDGSYAAQITFDSVSYVVKQGDKFDVVNGENHYYLVTETAPEGASADTTAYVVKVNVKQGTNKTKLEAKEVERWYADDVNQGIVDTIDKVEFFNTDTYDLISAASYSVYAASGEPVDQVCYVDPKIIKNLEGRAIKSGEFAFKLIQVANYNDTEGEVISAATNDEFGMVDFDKANNKGTLENPTCLAYTDRGTYYYRVIEDTSKGGMKDQSVLYSDQVITFTTVIDKNEKTGKLVCADMYYGYWDKAANKNVPFKEQYTDYETQPANIGDMSKLNPDWHPTITNKARPMDLQVRKTSVTDRDEGLVGATYALYMVNDNVQGDIWLAEATSEEGGWITYKNVSLSTNNLYYFKETAAPAGHTVSEFRSPYFYLVEDATSPNGYTLKYSDTKYFDAANDQAGADTQAEATEPIAEVQAVALQNNAAAPAEAAETAAAQAEAAATDDTVQPGHSADGNILLTYDKDGGVYDEATQLEVNKLDTRTHEWVEGAKLVIIEKDSGKEVNSWTSGKAPEKLEKTLNVGTTYLLREVEAPGQYRLAEDVEFVIDNYGNVSITKGTENGNAELSDNTITLYDTMMDAEEVQRRNRETTREVPIGARLAQTGDLIPLAAIGLIVVVSLIALAVAARRRRSEKDSDN